MPGPDPHHPKVFISYSHDSLDHSDRVRELSDRLRADGIDCILDQYEVSPSEGWPRWTDNQIGDAEFVLMICTETYYRRVMAREEPGIGLGVRWEGNLIYQHVYFEIDVMLPDEALKFLLARTGQGDDNAAETEAAEQIAGELGHLPLALEQAGAFITAKKARFQDYVASYRKRRLELLQESGPIAGDYPESVATTWSINFSEIEKTSEAASDLLRTSAFLSPDRIPFELIARGKSELGPALSAALADVDDDPLALNEVLEPLTRYSFIRLDSDSQTYSI